MTPRHLIALLLAGFLTISPLSSAYSKDKPKDQLKQKLAKRFFTDSAVIFLQEGLYAGEYSADAIVGKMMNLVGFSKYKMSTEYFHYYDPVDVVRGTTPLGDGRTFQHLTGAYGGSPIEARNEKLRIIELRVEKDAVAFYLEADQMRHGGAGTTATRQVQTQADPRSSTQQTSITKGKWGVAYYFMFPKEMIDNGDYENVVREIDKILILAHEASDLLKDTVSSSNISAPVGSSEGNIQSPRGETRAVPPPVTTTKTVEIKPGMTRQQVIKALGQPQQVVVYGTKEVLKYADLSVVLVDGRVTDVR